VAWGDQPPPASDVAPQGRVIVLDDRTGSKTTVDLGRACDAVYVIDGSAGRFLVECGVDGPDRPRTQQLVLDARNRAVTTVGDEQTAELDIYHRIGRYWLEGTHDSSGHQVIIYTNWHTFETRSQGALFDEARTPFDLNSRNLDPVGPPASDFVVGSSQVLAQVRIGRRHAGYAIDLMNLTRDRRLYRCSGPCYPKALKGGLALWINGPGSLYGYAVRARRHLLWNMPDQATVQGSTAERVYYSTPNSSNAQLLDLRSFRWRR
jgi:hypothetical protein